MVPFANGKGGVGKTSLACSYAVEQARKGASVVLADLNDEQQTATTWARVRDHNGILPRIIVMAATPRRVIEMVGRYDFLVVDTPSWTDKNTLALAKAATFMVIPSGPNPSFDLEPTVRLLHGFHKEVLEVWRYGVALSRFRPDAKGAAEEEEFARAYLAQAGYMALKGCVPNAPQLNTALAQGYGLSEAGKGDATQHTVELLGSIHTAVMSAERHLSKQRTQSLSRDSGGRER